MNRLSKRLDFMPKTATIPDPLYPAQYINISWQLTTNTLGTTSATYDLNTTIETPIPNAWFYYEIRGIGPNYVEGVTAPTTAEVYTDVNGDIAIATLLTRNAVDSDPEPGSWTVDIYRGWDLANKTLLYSIVGNTHPVLEHSDKPLVGAFQEFGYDVAISGNNIVTSEHKAGSGQFPPESGIIYLYDAATGNLNYTINNPNPSTVTAIGNWFGKVVDIDGNYAIASAFANDSKGVDDAGQAFIFDVTTGNLFRTLDNPDTVPAVKSYFGAAVSIKGNLALVGMSNGLVNNKKAGRAYIIDITTGNVLHRLDNPNPRDQDLFGSAVAINSDYAVVGAYNKDVGSISGAGYAYAFDVTTGALLWSFPNPSPTTGGGVGESFGESVAVHGDYAIIGAYRDDSREGSAYIYDLTTGALSLNLDNPQPIGFDPGGFGHSVDMNDNYAVVGAPANDHATVGGKVYIFDRNTETLLRTIVNPEPGDGDYFGESISFDGDKLVIGAPEDNEQFSYGKIYIYDMNLDTITGSVTL